MFYDLKDNLIEIITLKLMIVLKKSLKEPTKYLYNPDSNGMWPWRSRAAYSG
jgi:hypothetical protein